MDAKELHDRIEELDPRLAREIHRHLNAPQPISEGEINASRWAETLQNRLYNANKLLREVHPTVNNQQLSERIGKHLKGADK